MEPPVRHQGRQRAGSGRVTRRRGTPSRAFGGTSWLLWLAGAGAVLWGAARAEAQLAPLLGPPPPAAFVEGVGTDEAAWEPARPPFVGPYLEGQAPGALGAEPDEALAAAIPDGGTVDAGGQVPTGRPGAVIGPLPPARPAPDVAPLLSGRAHDPHEPVVRPPPVAPAERPRAVVRVILGMLVLLALAYLGGHPRVRQWEGRLGITQVVTAGLPFLLLGTVARLPGIDILSPAVLTDISPVLRFGLGLLGFAAGLRLETRLLGQLPEKVWRVVGASTLLPFTLVAVSTGVVLLFLLENVDAFGNPVFLRDALILGTAGAMTATSATLLLPASASDETRKLTATLVRLEELAGIAGLAVVAAYFRPGGTAATWQLPGTAWLLLTFGLGLAVGLLALLILQRANADAEFILFTLGVVSFAAGLAGQLNLSSVVVCFLVGAILGNLSGDSQQRLTRALRRLERPVYLLFLAVVGALWDVGAWVGWVLLPVFVLSRIAGKWASTRTSIHQTDLLPEESTRRALAAAPIGSMAVAIVVDSHQLYPGGAIAPITTAVVGGMLLTEGLVQFLLRTMPASGNGDTKPSAGGAG